MADKSLFIFAEYTNSPIKKINHDDWVQILPDTEIRLEGASHTEATRADLTLVFKNGEHEHRLGILESVSLSVLPEFAISSWFLHDEAEELGVDHPILTGILEMVSRVGEVTIDTPSLMGTGELTVTLHASAYTGSARVTKEALAPYIKVSDGAESVKEE